MELRWGKTGGEGSWKSLYCKPAILHLILRDYYTSNHLSLSLIPLFSSVPRGLARRSNYYHIGITQYGSQCEGGGAGEQGRLFPSKGAYQKNRMRPSLGR